MVTYTAVVAYPREIYGYFMLILISAYFALEGCFHFGDIYHLILKFAIKRCKKDLSLQKYGERGGSVVECRTPEREVRGSKPTAAVLCP